MAFQAPSNSEIATHIDELPDLVLARILSLLPTKEAVVTSTLSRRWKKIWTATSVLNFVFDKAVEEDYQILLFIRFVTTVLHHHNAQTIKQFRVIFDIENPFDYNLALWMDNVMKRRVKEVELKLHPCYPLAPRSLFNSATLKTLKLQVNLKILALDSVSVQFPHLRVLHLERVTFKHHNCLVKLFVGCPLLEELVITNLEEGCSNCKSSISEITLNCLLRATIGIQYVELCLISLIFQTCCGAPSLDISSSTSDVLELQIHHIGIFPKVFNCLHLEVSFAQFYRRIFLMKFLELCPKLQALVIHKAPTDFQSYCQPNQERIFNPGDHPPNCVLSHLRTFCMKGYEGWSSELEIVEHILHSAKMIKILTINFASSVPVKERKQISNDISTLASETCEIQFQ